LCQISSEAARTGAGEAVEEPALVDAVLLCEPVLDDPDHNLLNGVESETVSALTPNTVELIPTLGALPPRGGPVPDPDLTLRISEVGV